MTPDVDPHVLAMDILSRHTLALDNFTCIECERAWPCDAYRAANAIRLGMPDFLKLPDVVPDPFPAHEFRVGPRGTDQCCGAVIQIASGSTRCWLFETADIHQPRM